jgi:hypothetical protein
MLQTLTKNWWLLALAGILETIISLIYLVMYRTGPDSYLTFHGWNGAVAFLSKVTLAAGLSIIAAGIWKSGSGRSWLLVLNGLVLGTYGLLGVIGPIPHAFSTFAQMIVVMAIAFGIVALAIARSVRSHAADTWFFGLAGAGSLGFALAFLALANGLVPLERRAFHPAIFLWVCIYFGFSAICMLGMGLRLHGLASQPIPVPVPSRPFEIQDTHIERRLARS